MFRFNKAVIFLIVAIASFASACSPSQSVAPLAATDTPIASAIIPTDTATPLPDPSDSVPQVAQSLPTASPTDEPTPTFTPTIEPSVTPTSTPSPTVTATPTATPPAMLGGCAEIWQPGYYKLANDIKSPPGRDCFYIQSHNVVFDCDNHTIEGNTLNVKDSQYQFYAFWVRKFNFPLLETPTNIEIKNCKVKHHRAGIFVSDGNNIYLHHNDLSNNSDDTNKDRFGIFLGKTEGGGIRLGNVKGGIVEHNVTNNEAIGIDVRDSERIIVRNNTAEKNSAWGISFTNTSNSEISNNTTRDNVRYCAWGNGTVAPGCDAGGVILQDGSSHNVVKNNNVSGQNGNGIFIKAHAQRCGDDNLIQDNKVIDALWNAIEFSFCKDNKVVGNEIRGSYDAVWFGFSTNTEIRNNVISDMRNHGIISYNSRGSIVTSNQIFNSREGVYFYWDTWDQKAFFFLTPSPDRYASRDNLIASNIIQGNSAAGIRLLDSIYNRIENNLLAHNGRDFRIEGKTEGNVIITPTPAPTPTPLPTATPTLTLTPTLTATRMLTLTLTTTPTLTATLLPTKPITATATPVFTRSLTPSPPRP
jgi:parallel beta-helix repeat protein